MLKRVPEKIQGFWEMYDNLPFISISLSAPFLSSLRIDKRRDDLPLPMSPKIIYNLPFWILRLISLRIICFYWPDSGLGDNCCSGFTVFSLLSV